MNSIIMKDVRTEIIINASPERVWSILIDFPRYPEWNPFVREVKGKIAVGEKLKVYVKPENSRGMRFNATITKINPNKEFRWVGRLLFPGILDGEHIFIIQPMGRNKIKFMHSERFTGLLSVLGGLNKLTQSGLSDMNHALKRRCERF